MTIDDESSVYVGGLPYDATEGSVRRVFEHYGAVVAVKIINDASARGKCYGFVTFRNPRSAVHAINGMDGRTVDGRVIRVNEVRTRGGRLGFGREREGFRGNAGRERNLDRGQDHEREYDRDRVRYSDRYSSDRSRERNRGRSFEDDEERERVYEGERDYDQVRDHFVDRDRYQDRDLEDNLQRQGRSHEEGWERDQALESDGDREMDETKSHNGISDKDRDRFFNRDRYQERDLEDNEQGRSRNHDQGWEGDRALDSDRDREMDKTKNQNNSAGKDRDQHSRRWNGSNSVDRKNWDLLPHSSADSNDQVKEQLERSIRTLEEIKTETFQMEESLEEKGIVVLELQKKSKKLEDALINAKKHSSHQKMQLAKLHKSFVQVKDYSERLKSCEHELQSIVDTEMLEYVGDDVGLRDGMLTIGNA